MNKKTKDIQGWPGYKISEDGDVYSCRTNGGKCSESWKNKKPNVNPGGYYQVKLHYRQKAKLFRIHTLVLTTFAGTRPVGMVACHINGNKIDNRVENLRWGSPKENSDDRELHGNTARGESNGRSIMIVEAVQKLKLARETTRLSYEKLAKQFGISKRQTMRIIKNECWHHVDARPEIYIRRAELPPLEPASEAAALGCPLWEDGI